MIDHGQSLLIREEEEEEEEEEGTIATNAHLFPVIFTNPNGIGIIQRGSTHIGDELGHGSEHLRHRLPFIIYHVLKVVTLIHCPRCMRSY